MKRYRMARVMGNFDEIVTEDQQLLDRYGLHLLSVEGGVHAAVKAELGKNGRVQAWNCLTLDEKTWTWLRPILLHLDELDYHRAAK